MNCNNFYQEPETYEPRIDDCDLTKNSKRVLKNFIFDIYSFYNSTNLIKTIRKPLSPWSRTYKLGYRSLKIDKYIIYRYYKILVNERNS